ncbi:MAG: hypothetical protein HRU26_11345 [Psychroserpens sp.]|nr:hypothetical protein [Psychroserpens sp.]
MIKVAEVVNDSLYIEGKCPETNIFKQGSLPLAISLDQNQLKDLKKLSFTFFKEFLQQIESWLSGHQLEIISDQGINITSSPSWYDMQTKMYQGDFHEINVLPKNN